MEEASPLPVPEPANPGKSRRRRQFTILMACILIATSLWFLRAFENDYTTRIVHSVKYINQPENLMNVNPLPRTISLEVKGLGFSVVRHNWYLSNTPLTIDLKNLKTAPYRRKKGFVEYMPMNQYINAFSNQLKDLKVIAILPDTLVFRFVLKKIKNVRIIPAFIYESGSSIKDEHLLRISPDSVEVEGPDFIMDTLQYIRTLPIRINKKGSSENRNYGLEKIHRLVKFKPVEVAVSFGNNS